MTPILHSSTSTGWTTNGLGALADAISWEVTEERNGIFELTMVYPVTGIHYGDISNRCIIMAKPNPYEDPQPFRIYRITKPMSGQITIYAQHLSYDLSGIPVSPFSSVNVSGALSGLKSNSAIDNPFDFWTDKTTEAAFLVAVPSSIRALLGGQEGSILDVYGGEYKWDGYTIRLYNHRGQDRGVTIRYGKNLTNIEQDTNIANMATGVYPYWTNNEGVLVEVPGKIVEGPGTYDFTHIIPLDLSGEFQEQPTSEQLQARAVQYVSNNNIGVPTVNIKVEFQPLEQTEEYKDIALLQRVNLCDTVTVEYPAIGVSVTAKCIKTVYDGLLDRYSSIELGDVKSNIATTIANQQQQIEALPTMSTLELATQALTAAILGAKGGAVRLLDTNNDGMPDTLYIADNPDPGQAVKVWRWNYEGWGASANGYNGPFTMGATLDQGIVADFITAGTLNASLIKAGTLDASLIKTGILSSVNGASTINMATGDCDLQGSIMSRRTWNDGTPGSIWLSPQGVRVLYNANPIGGIRAQTNDGVPDVELGGTALALYDYSGFYRRIILLITDVTTGGKMVHATFDELSTGKIVINGRTLELKTTTVGDQTINYLGY